MKLLSRAEEIILVTVLKLKDNAYGVAIRERLFEETGVRWSFGSIYTPLNTLTRKNLVSKKYGKPSSERGGRRKCLYTVTRTGLEALREIHRVQTKVWSDLPYTFEKEGK